MGDWNLEENSLIKWKYCTIVNIYYIIFCKIMVNNFMFAFSGGLQVELSETMIIGDTIYHTWYSDGHNILT